MIVTQMTGGLDPAVAAALLDQIEPAADDLIEAAYLNADWRASLSTTLETASSVAIATHGDHVLAVGAIRDAGYLAPATGVLWTSRHLPGHALDAVRSMRALLSGWLQSRLSITFWTIPGHARARRVARILGGTEGTPVEIAADRFLLPLVFRHGL